MKLEIKIRRKMGTGAKMWTLNDTFLNSQWVKAKIKRDIKKIHGDKDGKKIYQKLLGGSKRS